MALRGIDEKIIIAARDGSRDDLETPLKQARPDIRRYAMKHCLIGDVDDAV